jgi:Nucleotidyl transferase AbiEii toxin, Type IV TA system
MDVDKLLQFVRAMNDEGVEYVTFGAIAMGVHALPRATEDADFFVAPTRENIERLKRALRSVWDDPQIDEISAEDLLGDYPSVRYGPPEDDFTIDFLTRLGEIYPYEKLVWEVKDLDGLPIRVVTPRMLYEMKKDTIRYKDRIDADVLRRKFGFAEE